MASSSIYSKPRQRISVMLSENMYLAVRARAQRSGDTLAGVLRNAFIRYIEDQRDSDLRGRESGKASTSKGRGDPVSDLDAGPRNRRISVLFAEEMFSAVTAYAEETGDTPGGVLRTAFKHVHQDSAGF